MRNAIYSVLVLALCSVLAGAATAQTPMSFKAGFGVYTDYAWRGYQVTDAASAQPSAQVSWPSTGFSFGFWSNFAVQDRDVYEDLDKLELNLGYKHNFETATPTWLSAGVLYHSFPRFDGNNSTTELVVGYGLENYINPSLVVYRDIDQTEAWYINPSVSHSFPLDAQEHFNLDLNFGLGFTDKLFDENGDEGFGLQNLDARASVGIAVSGNAVVRPTIAYSRADQMIYADENIFWGGASLDWSW